MVDDKPASAEDGPVDNQIRHVEKMLAKWADRERHAHTMLKSRRIRLSSLETFKKWRRRERHAHRMALRWKRKLRQIRRYQPQVSTSGIAPTTCVQRLVFCLDPNERLAMWKLNDCESRDEASPFEAETKTETVPATSEGCGAPQPMVVSGTGWKIPQDVKGDINIDVDALRLSARPANVLKRLGLLTVTQLLSFEKNRVLQSKNCGKKSISEIEQKLLKYLETGQTKTRLYVSGGAIRSEEWSLPAEFRGDLAAPVNTLGLSARAEHIMEWLGIKTVRDLVSCPKLVLAETRSCGSKTIAQIETKVLNYLANRTISSLSFNGTKAVVEQILALLPARESFILKKRYGLWDGSFATLEQLGADLGVSRERIRQLEEASKRILKASIGRSLQYFVNDKLKSTMTAADPIGQLDEARILAEFGDDCTPFEASLALNFIQDLQPKDAVRMYRRKVLKLKECVQ